MVLFWLADFLLIKCSYIVQITESAVWSFGNLRRIPFYIYFCFR